MNYKKYNEYLQFRSIRRYLYKKIERDDRKALNEGARGCLVAMVITAIVFSVVYWKEIIGIII